MIKRFINWDNARTGNYRLVVTGRDEQNFKKIFNDDVFSKNFDLTLKQNDHGMLDDEEVITEITALLKEQKEIQEHVH